MRRPASLAEVADWSRSNREFFLNVADFLDQFAIERRFGMLSAEPGRLSGDFEGGEIADAYLAAIAVALSRDLSTAPPAWAWDETRKLRRPWFAHPGMALRATLLLESPAAFRERNLFVSANALTRM